MERQLAGILLMSARDLYAGTVRKTPNAVFHYGLLYGHYLACIR